MNGPRYIAWLSAQDAGKLREKLKAQAVKVHDIGGKPCKALRPSKGVSFVAPEIWDADCKRQGLWYHESKKAGLLLVVAPDDLVKYGVETELVVSLTDVKGPRQATAEDVRVLLEEEAFSKLVPEGWSHKSEEGKKKDMAAARRWGSQHSDWDELHRLQTAGHGNYITPRITIEEDGKQVPVPIADTAHSCSACLEFFNILGEAFPKKYVTPCIGAVIYAKMEKDGMYGVEAASDSSD
jgi:hypothetical protein